jgi:hypothetical protein
MAFNIKDMSFHWRGRDKQGVSKWTGSAKPLRWLALIFGIYGPLAGIGAISVLVYGLLTHHLTPGLMTLVSVGATHFVVFTGIALWSRAMYRHVMRLKPADQMCASLGIAPEALQQIAEARKIKPRLILNEQPYYDPAEFTDALSLLRGSSIPQAAPATLLRPAASGEKTAPEELLRMTEGVTQPVDGGVSSRH